MNLEEVRVEGVLNRVICRYSEYIAGLKTPILREKRQAMLAFAGRIVVGLVVQISPEDGREY